MSSLRKTAKQLEATTREHEALRQQTIDMIVDMRMAAYRLQRIIDKPICGPDPLRRHRNA